MWKDKYLELMFSNDPKKHDSLEGFKLKHLNIPPLYKYRKIDKYALANLENNTAWFSKATDFNDPYDSVLTIGSEETFDENNKEALITNLAKNFEVSTSEIESLLGSHTLKQTLVILLGNSVSDDTPKEQIEEVANKIVNSKSIEFNKLAKNVANLYQDKIFASCFSEDPTSMLMWSHYADNHKGFVIEYDFKTLDIEKHQDVLWGLHPVNYVEDMINLKDYTKVREHMNLLTLASISKSIEWSYENEWRMIVLKDTEKGFNLSISKPSSIILGARVDQVNKIMLSIEAKKKGIQLKQIKLDHSSYHLEVVEFDGVF